MANLQQKKLNLRSLSLVLLSFMLTGCGYSSYEECLLEQMRGQDVSMQQTAQRYCEQNFPYEKKIWPVWGEDGEIDISFRSGKNFKTHIWVSKNTTGYKPTRATMAFSSGKCKDSSSDDFTMKFAFDLNQEGEGSIYRKPMANGLVRALQCGKLVEAYGILE